MFLFVFASVVAVIIRQEDQVVVTTKLFSYDDLFNPQLQPKRVSLNWWNGKPELPFFFSPFFSEDTTLIKRDIGTGNILFSSVDGTITSLLVNSSLVIDVSFL